MDIINHEKVDVSDCNLCIDVLEESIKLCINIINKLCDKCEGESSCFIYGDSSWPQISEILVKYANIENIDIPPDVKKKLLEYKEYE